MVSLVAFAFCFVSLAGAIEWAVNGGWPATLVLLAWASMAVGWRTSDG